jgi:hypothetical protein
LLRRARATVVCQPHFPGALNERIVHAMQAGCAVIATPNARTSREFVNREHLLTTAVDLSDLDALIDEVGRPEIAEPMRERARARVSERHLPEHRIRSMLDFLAECGFLDVAIEVFRDPQL